MDNTVDRFLGPGSEPAFGFGEPTKLTLARFVAALNKANAAVHPCPEEPESTTKVTISGAPGVLELTHCPFGGEFAIMAIAVHKGHAYVFFSHDRPTNESALRAAFATLLEGITFDE
jgi:hypothetical protein